MTKSQQDLHTRFKIYNPEELKNRASDRKKQNLALFRRLKKTRPKALDQAFSDSHDEVFKQINCLDCANCCKSISPFLTDRDIQRISGFLKIKPAQFVTEYLTKDEEDDYVFRTNPCPFLLKDNCCSIYDSRPKACREYPHTNRRRMIQIFDLTLKNTGVCPAVFEIVEILHKKYK